jgi:lauroyl/myristoyl acyltransferase
MRDLLFQSLKLACRFPRRLRRALSFAAGTVAWAAAGEPRRSVTANVRQVLGVSSGSPLASRLRVQLVARRIFCHCVSNYLELFALPRLTRTEILGRIDVKGREYFEQAAALGRGVIIASAHLGPFEYLPSWFPARGFEMTIPVEKIGDNRILGMMLEARLSNGVTFVPLTGLAAVRTMLRTLNNGQVVLITADRAIEGQSAILNFFGAPARLPLGPVDLSAMTGAPLIGGFGWRNGSRDVIEFVPISLALPEQQRSDRETLQTLLIRRLERIIGDHIDEWVVFEPIWRQPDRLPRGEASEIARGMANETQGTNS